MDHTHLVTEPNYRECATITKFKIVCACTNKNTRYCLLLIETTYYLIVKRYLSLCLLSRRTVGSKQVALVKVASLELLGLHIAYGLIIDWYASECFNLHPAHQVLGSTVLVQIYL